MERINIDDDFKDWLIGHLPLFLVSNLYQAYAMERAADKIASRDKEEQTFTLDLLSDKAMLMEMQRFRDHLDKIYPNKVDE